MLVFRQVLILLCFITVGYILSKCGKVNPSQSKILSSLLVNVFIPCSTLKTFAGSFTVAYLRENYVLVTTSLVMILSLGILAFFAGKLFSREKYMQRVYEYTLVTPNIGYVGYPLVQGLYGSTGLLNFMLFAIPFNLYIFGYGYPRLTKTKASWKALCNPAILAMVVGAVIGLTGIQLPEVATDILGKANNCVGPVSMLLTGIVISEYRFSEILREPRVYIMTALRLFLIPLAVGGIVSLFASKEVIRIAVLTLALPCGLNTVVFPKLVNENCKIGAGLALVSHVAACVSIPIVVWLFGL